MALVINEEQNMLKSSAKELLDLKSPISHMRELRDDNYNQFDIDLWKEMVEMGWTALIIPEEYNGLNFGYVGVSAIDKAKTPYIDSLYNKHANSKLITYGASLFCSFFLASFFFSQS